MNTTLHARWRANRRGAMAMSAAMALITVNDSMIKLASESLPAAETIGIRGVFATAWVLLAVLAARQTTQLLHALELRTVGRALLDVAGTFSYLYALFHMPLAEAIAINMAAPLIMVLFAAVFLREQLRWQRMAAVLAGFAGMLLVVRPGGSNFTWWTVLCLVATVLNAARDVYTKRIPLRVPSVIITFAAATAVTFTALTITTIQGWQPISPVETVLLAGASAFLAASYFLLIVAMRLGDISAVSGFRYSALPAAALLGWVIWGYLPDAISCTGMGVLVVAGLYLLRHERAGARIA
jgi:drug/metabolite transporter (DMT)-like permease